MQAEVAAWERALTTNMVRWMVLDPISFTSSNGATLTKQNDRSILATGQRPEKDTYTIVARAAVPGITAVRLEVMTDDSLPHKGPGRQDNGNLHLSEFKLFGLHPIPLQRPTADFDQEGWTIAHAIDGVEKTAWGIYPQVGKPHQGVFELKEPIANDAGATLTFVLEQQHGGGHVIGRLRLSVTSAPQPVRVNQFPESIAAVVATPREQRTAAQQHELAAFYLREKIERELAALPPPRLVYAAANDFAPDGGHLPARRPRPVRVLVRGEISRPAELAFPGALSCVTGLKSSFELADLEDEGARRAALAKWITDPKNPLTWRSIVNRVWHHHFGRGLVDTPNDFGRMGGQPSHPELLDWLALWFLDRGGSLKQLHRLILTSAVYQQSSRIPVTAHSSKHAIRGSASKAARSIPMPGARAAEVDADNRLLWRMNRSRLEAECIRDAILQITGQLDPRMGGPSFRNFALSPGIHVTPNVDYAKAEAEELEGRRRSIYRFLFRTLPDPFMDTLDCPAGDQLAPARADSVTALQALSMLNNQFVVRQSECFANRLQREANGIAGQVKRAFELALGRTPTAEEIEEMTAYASKHGLANACRLLFNSNEFMFVN
jgi:hypothetical protein